MRAVIFDLDGTLVDSDAALTVPFVALGVDPARIPLGLPLGEACELAGISVEAYLAHYDSEAVAPFPGVEAMLAGIDRWAVCSNKARVSGLAELDRLGWSPEVAMFSDDFGGRSKRLDPLLRALDVAAHVTLFVGDTGHDRVCAASAGVPFAVAGWNPRAKAEEGDLLLSSPGELLAMVRSGESGGEERPEYPR